MGAAERISRQALREEVMPIKECKRCAIEFDALNAKRLYCFECRAARSPSRIQMQEREGAIWRKIRDRGSSVGQVADPSKESL